MNDTTIDDCNQVLVTDVIVNVSNKLQVSDVTVDGHNQGYW